MRDYNRDDRSGGRRGGRRFGGGGRDFGRRELHHATCAQCGKDCEVPFRPSGDRPVYCSDCFGKRRSEDGNFRGSGGRNFSKPNFEERRSYSPDRGDRGDSRGRDSRQLIDQLENLHTKLDKIISFLEPKVETSLVVKNEVTDIVLTPKAVKAKTPKKKVKKQKVEPEKIPQS